MTIARLVGRTASDGIGITWIDLAQFRRPVVASISRHGGMRFDGIPDTFAAEVVHLYSQLHHPNLEELTAYATHYVTGDRDMYALHDDESRARLRAHLAQGVTE